MAKKGKNKGSRGRPCKYHASFVDKVGVIIRQMCPFNAKGKLATTKIVKVLGISSATFDKWRTPGTAEYRSGFAVEIMAAEKEARESMDLCLIRTGVIKRAQGFKKVKITKEPVETGPSPPPYSRFSKADLIKYANKVLGLKLNKGLKKPVIEIAIRNEITEQTVEEMKVVKVEEEHVPSDVAAAKY